MAKPELTGTQQRVLQDMRATVRATERFMRIFNELPASRQGAFLDELESMLPQLRQGVAGELVGDAPEGSEGEPDATSGETEES